MSHSTNTQHAIALKFRQLAETFDQLAASLRADSTTGILADWNYHQRLESDAGKLIVAAVKRGYLSVVPEVVQLVESRVKRSKWLPVCHAGLFGELRGSSGFGKRRSPDGKWRLIRTYSGGCLPSLYPEAFPAIQIGSDVPEEASFVELMRLLHVDLKSTSTPPARRFEAMLRFEHSAIVCRLLAQLVAETQTTPDEARGKWVYDRAIEGWPWKRIRIEIPRQSPEWEPVETDNGVKDIARRYAKRHGLPLPPPRKRGRLKNTK